MVHYNIFKTAKKLGRYSKLHYRTKKEKLKKNMYPNIIAHAYFTTVKYLFHV